MVAEFGQLTLAWALAAAAVQALAGLAGGHRDAARLMALAERAAAAQAVLIGVAFLALTTLHVTSDFSVLNVVENSHTAKPLVYKISGVWGNHEGSMLLWCFVLALYTAALIAAPGATAPRFRARVIGVLGLVATAFAAFVIFTSNPFARIDPPLTEGADLNPLLQDPGLALHPPFLYLGYVGFAVSFAFATAALIERREGTDWAAWARPWALVAWTFMTVGIGLGAWWAYYELGWGGFWAWDPVENASLMPWIAGAALIHSLKATTDRGVFRHWTMLLAILAFSLSLVGTFLVRSGVLTSVHAFAVDPARGVFILLILSAAVGGSLTLYALRARPEPPAAFEAVSRETAILLNNLMLMTVCATVFLGTFYPVFADIFTGERVSVGAPYFNLVLAPFAWLLMALAGAAAFTPWRRGDPKAIARVLAPAAGASVVILIVIAAFYTPRRVGAVLTIAIAAWLAAAAAVNLVRRMSRDGDWRARARSLAAVPLCVWGMNVAHLGVATVAVGAAGAGALRTETIQFMNPGDAAPLAGGRTVRLVAVEAASGPNYAADAARFEVRRGDRVIARTIAERRYYPVRRMATAEAGIHTMIGGDVYVTLGAKTDARGWPVHVSFFPFTVWLWIGAALVAAGGALTIAGHVRAVRAPARPVVGAGAAEPAE